MTNAYNTTRTQNVEKMYLRVVVENNPTFIIRKDNEVVWELRKDSEGFNLFHYGTWILTIRYDGTIRNGYGYSRTDARNINGLLSLFNIHNVRAHIVNGTLRID